MVSDSRPGYHRRDRKAVRDAAASREATLIRGVMDPGEIRARLESAERRLLEHDDDISETRRVVLDIKESLAGLRGPVVWMQRLAFVIATGILGTLGLAAWVAIQGTFRR